jgi:hypothetical protein
MALDGNSPILLNLTLDKTNMILGALGMQPYDKVAGIIGEIQQQATSQLRAVASLQESSTVTE